MFQEWMKIYNKIVYGKENNKMCKYCEKDSELYNDHSNSHSVILKMAQFPENKVRLGIDLYCGCEETSFLQYIDISYCPMCGRKLCDKNE